MSAAATLPDPTPPQAPAGRLLAFVRRLVDYGSKLAASLQHRNAPTANEEVTALFGTNCVAMILARIALALHRAGLLEARIVRSAARLDADIPRRSPSPRKSPIAPPDAVPTRKPSPPIAGLPPIEQIAARLRRQSIGEVIADICFDLGIPPSHPLWRELRFFINKYGGDFARFGIRRLNRVLPIGHIRDGLKAKPAKPSTSASTGPPPAIQPAT